MIELKRLAEFQRHLSVYQPSDKAKRVLRNIQMVVLSGIAGGGRNTIINHLVATGRYDFVVSDTTRPPKVRDGKLEQNGVHYFFRSEADMLADLHAGVFLEAEIIHQQQVSGTSIRELERIHKNHKIAALEVEYGGANNIAKTSPNAYMIGVLPPSFAEWQRRWQGREQQSLQEFNNRMRTAEKVLGNLLDKPYFTLVINDSLEQCVQDIRNIVETGTYSPSKVAAARTVATQLYLATKAYLEQPKV